MSLIDTGVRNIPLTIPGTTLTRTTARVWARTTTTLDGELITTYRARASNIEAGGESYVDALASLLTATRKRARPPRGNPG